MQHTVLSDRGHETSHISDMQVVHSCLPSHCTLSRLCHPPHCASLVRCYCAWRRVSCLRHGLKTKQSLLFDEIFSLTKLFLLYLCRRFWTYCSFLSTFPFSMRRFLVALISITITSLLPWNGIAQPTKLEHLKPVEITELGHGKDNASGMECYNLNGPEIIMARGRAWNRKMLRQRKHVQDAEWILLLLTFIFYRCYLKKVVFLPILILEYKYTTYKS